MLGLLQLDEHLLPFCLAGGEVDGAGTAEHGMAARAGKVMGEGGGAGILLPEGIHVGGVLGELFPGGCQELPHPEALCPVSQVALRVPEEEDAEHRQQHDHHQPGDFGRRVHGAVQQVEHHPHREERVPPQK